MTEFNVADENTWGLVLSLAQVAAIYQRSTNAVRKSCQQGRFVPAPFLKYPYRWRKVDVLRQLVGSRSVGQLRAV